MLGSFGRITLGTLLLMLLAIPFVNLIAVPIGLYLLITGIRRARPA